MLDDAGHCHYRLIFLIIPRHMRYRRAMANIMKRRATDVYLTVGLSAHYRLQRYAARPRLTIDAYQLEKEPDAPSPSFIHASVSLHVILFPRGARALLDWGRARKLFSCCWSRRYEGRPFMKGRMKRLLGGDFRSPQLLKHSARIHDTAKSFIAADAKEEMIAGDAQA